MIAHTFLAFAFALLLQQAPPEVLRVGQGVSAPTLARRVDPQYSDAARRARIQGTVVLEAIVSEDGTVKVNRVVRSLDPGLDQNAMAALEQWQFRPAMKDGKPVKVVLNVEVNFNLSSP